MRPAHKDESRSSSWQTQAGNTDAWKKGWSSSSRWDRPYAWSVLTNANLTGPDHDTDREWHANRKQYASTHHALSLSGPSPRILIDRRSDPALPSGSTSKTWQDQDFWAAADSSSVGSSAITSQATQSTHWRRRLHTGRAASSHAGDNSEGSTSGPRLGLIDEISQLDEDALGTLQERVTQALASRW